jgi:hypothetical protein
LPEKKKKKKKKKGKLWTLIMKDSLFLLMVCAGPRVENKVRLSLFFSIISHSSGYSIVAGLLRRGVRAGE